MSSGVPGEVAPGEVVLVIGADGPVASAVIDRLLDASARVALVGRDRRFLEEQAARFRSRGSEAFVLNVDCTDPSAVERMRSHIEQRLGPIDVLVLPADSPSAVLDAVGPDMARRGTGRVEFLSRSS